jgi:3-dehydroquinate synthase class II
MEKWVELAIDKIKKIELSSEADRVSINNVLHILTHGKGWLTGDQPIKIFFFSEMP